MKLWAKIFLALGTGILAGAILGPKADIFSPIGNGFLQLLNMLIVPLIFSSMVCGIAHIPNTKELGRIGAMTLGLYIISTLAAIALGMFLSFFVPLGSQMAETVRALTPYSTASAAAMPLPSQDIGQLFLSLIPKNPIKAFAEQNIIQVIMFALFFGVALHHSGSRGAPLREVIDALAAVMQKLTTIIMYLSPIGVFALMASAVGNMGISVLVPVLFFLLLYYAGCLLHIGLVFCPLLRVAAQLHITPFFVSIKELFATAISTCSSSASLPIAVQCVTERLGVSRSLANFVLPLGCSLNMNGSALFQSMAALFMAQAYGIEITSSLLITLTCTVLFSTIGTAGIPGGGFMMLSVVFSSLGIPLECLALLAGVDRLRDMGTTTVNVLGDTVCAVVVSARERDLDHKIYYSKSNKNTSACAGD